MLQRYCHHVIHHDLAWNPSSIEQRTGRVDRLGCKAEGREPISVYLPSLAGAADERQYWLMTEREQWFRVVMGQDEVARLITPDSNAVARLPRSIADELSFNLELDAHPVHAYSTGLPCSTNWFSLFPPENSLFDQTNSLFRGVGNSKLKPHDISGLGGFVLAYSRPNPQNSLFFPC